MAQAAPFEFDFIAEALADATLYGASGIAATAICTDSRAIESGQLFLALVGDNFDGHDFVSSCLGAGAVGAVVSRMEDSWQKAYPDASFFLVEDTLRALGDLAHAWRMKCNPKVLAVTGSNGKTTTKEILASILKHKAKTLKTAGNLNNLIGLPLTMLSLRDERFAVVEMGMSEEGEIARLTEIARPDIGIITNVNEAHLESLGDINGVARAKGELFEALRQDDTAIVNIDDKRVNKLAAKCIAQKLTISAKNPKADFSACNIENGDDDIEAMLCHGKNSLNVRLPLPGRHNAANMLLAVAAAYAAGVEFGDMAKGISETRVPGARMRIRKDMEGFTLIDDCYNANPASMKVALELLSRHGGSGRSVAVLGDMLELGESSDRFHRELGKLVAHSGTGRLLVYGQYAGHVAAGALESGMANAAVSSFSDWENLSIELSRTVRRGDTILVKGSRSMHMERAIEILQTSFKTEA